MVRSLRNRIVALCAIGSVVAACHGPAPRSGLPTPAREQAHEDYCWWSVFRSPLPVDTVAARFTRAFEILELSSIASTRVADTVRLYAGPTVLGGAHHGGTYAVRVVAYQRGDSTHFRHFVAIAPPATGWPEAIGASARGENVGLGRHLAFCGELGTVAQTQGTAPRMRDGEESQAVWRNSP